MTMNRKEAYEYGIAVLTDAGIKEAKTDTLLLLFYICKADRNDIYVHGEELLSDKEEQSYRNAVEKRTHHIPVQYITGRQNFMGLEFFVDEHVLIPRQDTEILVEEVLKNLSDGFRILDMCTGSGCILLSLLRYSNNCVGMGVDVSEDALEVAKKNSEELSADATFLQSDLFTQVEGRFDMIVSNPPYIRSDVMETLMEEVREFEPMLALDGKEDGLFFYREIVKGSKTHLVSGGMLFFEIGYDQAADVTELMKQAGFVDITVEKDYAGLDRVVYGTLFGGNTNV